MNGANSGERSPLGPPPAVARFSTHSETAVLSKGGLVASGWILADPGRISPGFYSKTFLDEYPAPALRVWGGAIYQKHQKTLIKKIRDLQSECRHVTRTELTNVGPAQDGFY